MKKKIAAALAVCALAVMLTACGSGSASASKETSANETSAEAASGADTKETGKTEDKESSGTQDEKKEGAEAEETKETLDAEIEAQGPGATLEDEMNEEDRNFSDLENSDYNGFASQIVEAVKAKDMNALADLMAYPAYISCVKENDGIVDSKEAFLALDPEMVFDQSLIDAVSAADLSGLEPLVVGVVIGDDTPNIIFNSVDGELGITGINY